VILKIAASIIIVICCGLLGLIKANCYVQRVREIGMLKAALVQLETEVIHFSSFISEAMAKVGKSLQGPWKAFFYKVAQELNDKTEYTVGECWKKNLDYYKKHFFIGESEYEILVRFGEKLGTSDRESQRKYFELVQQQLHVEEKKAEQLCSKYERMYRSLGILCGLAIAIILF
jgi:stage III sporulation protein AB